MGNKVTTESENKGENNLDNTNEDKVVEEMMKRRQEYLEKMKNENKGNKMEIDSYISEENKEVLKPHNSMNVENDNVQINSKVDINSKDDVNVIISNNKVNINNTTESNNISINSNSNDKININNINNVNTGNNNVSNVVNINNPKKEIDLEHVAFEKIFKITLDESKSDKMKYMETYLAQLMSLDKDLKFRVNDLDSLIMILISEENKNVVSYLLSCYNRAYNIIEIKFKNDLKDKFSDFLKILASYISLLVLSPENFELDSYKVKFENDYNKYIEETFEKDFAELLNLFNNIENCSDEISQCQKLFEPLNNIFEKRNSESLMKYKSNVSFYY